MSRPAGIWTTRDVWAAAYLRARGLSFLRAETLPVGAFRVEFLFADLEGVAPALMREFAADAALQKFIRARQAMGAALEICRVHEVCRAEAIGKRKV